jgi:hypothetical protein
MLDPSGNDQISWLLLPYRYLWCGNGYVVREEMERRVEYLKYCPHHEVSIIENRISRYEVDSGTARENDCYTCYVTVGLKPSIFLFSNHSLYVYIY